MEITIAIRKEKMFYLISLTFFSFQTIQMYVCLIENNVLKFSENFNQKFNLYHTQNHDKKNYSIKMSKFLINELFFIKHELYKFIFNKTLNSEIFFYISLIMLHIM